MSCKILAVNCSGIGAGSANGVAGSSAHPAPLANRPRDDTDQRERNPQPGHAAENGDAPLSEPGKDDEVEQRHDRDKRQSGAEGAARAGRTEVVPGDNGEEGGSDNGMNDQRD